MVLFGSILLLPGICAIVFMASGGPWDSGLATLWFICLAIAAGGVLLLRSALRR
jgi:hypothetical protein